MKKILNLVFFACISFNVIGQYDYEGRDRTFLINNLTEGSFTVFDTTRYKLPMPRSESEVDWSKIEELALSKIYANTREWALKGYEEGEAPTESQPEEYYQKIREVSPDGEFIRPVCLYTYTVEDEEAAFLLFAFHTKGVANEFPLTLNAVKKNGRWYESMRLSMFSVSAVFSEYQEQVLYAIFKGEPTQNPMIDALMQKVRVNGRVSVYDLFDELVRLKENKESPEYNYLTRRWGDKEYPPIHFDGMSITLTAPVIQSMNLANAKSYRYKKWEYSVKGEMNNNQWLSELPVLYKDRPLPGDTLRFIRRITFTYFDKPVSIIKYSVGDEVKANVLELKNNVWAITDNPRFENLRLCMQFIKRDYWFDFFHNEFEQKIDAIKPYTRLYVQRMHNWNMDRLGEILKTKPEALAPYCDYPEN